MATGRVVPQELTEAFDKNYFPVKNEVSKLTSDLDLEFSSMALSQYVLTKYPELEKPAKDFSQAIENLGSNIKGTDLRTIGKDIVLQHSLQNKDFDFEAPLTKEQEKSFLNSLDAEQKNMQNYYILQQKGYNRYSVYYPISPASQDKDAEKRLFSLFTCFTENPEFTRG